MSDSIDMEVTGTKELSAYFSKMSSIEKTPEFNQAMLNASVIIEAASKKELRSMVYDLPEGWYHRTMAMFNQLRAQKIVSKEIDGYSVGVVSSPWYAKTVHDGLGIGRNSSPRPYLTRGLQLAKKDVFSVMSSFFPKGGK